jgi:hypothetical protein
MRIKVSKYQTCNFIKNNFIKKLVLRIVICYSTDLTQSNFVYFQKSNLYLKD